MAKTYDLGSVTSYAIAVEHGYEGTEEQFAQELTGATAAARAAAQDASDAEAYAIGKRDGVDVPSTDPAYQNNAKYWAQNSSGANLGDAFNPNTAYSAGDYVINLGKLWRFTTAHPAGAWTGNDATEVKAMDEVQSLKDDLDAQTNKTNSAFSILTALLRKVAYKDSSANAYYNELIEILGESIPTGISVTFTPTRQIYNLDTIDSLKEFLTVTISYSDGSHENTNIYTLSGEFTPGTQQFTVVVDEFYDTFAVNIVDAFGITTWQSSSDIAEIVDGQANMADSYSKGITFEYNSEAQGGTIRKHLSSKIGILKYRNKDDSQFIDIYPIPVKTGATSATVTVSPSSCYSFIKCVRYNPDADRYNGVGSAVQWGTGSRTVDLTGWNVSGVRRFLLINLKADNAGTGQFSVQPTVSITYN